MYSRIELNTTVLFDNQMEHYFPVQFLSRVQPGSQSKRCGRAPLRGFVRSRQPPPELSLTIRAVGSLYFLYLMTSNDYLMFRYCSICTSSKSLLRGLVQRRSVRYEEAVAGHLLAQLAVLVVSSTVGRGELLAVVVLLQRPVAWLLCSG